MYRGNLVLLQCKGNNFSFLFLPLSVEDEVSDIKQQKTVDVPTANSNHDNASKLDKDLHDGIQSENKGKKRLR